jgi:hypothetical protein
MANAEIFMLRNPGVEVTPKPIDFGKEPAPLLEDLPSVTARIEISEEKGRSRKYPVENPVETVVISYPWPRVLILDDNGLIPNSTPGSDKETRDIRIPIGSKPQIFHIRQFDRSSTPEFTIKIKAKEKPPEKTKQEKPRKTSKRHLKTASINPEMPPAVINRSTS